MKAEINMVVKYSLAEEQVTIEQIASAAQRLTDLALEVATLIEHFIGR